MSLGITIRESTKGLRFSIPASAIFILLLPSKEKGLVTIATVKIFISLANFAIKAVAALPVPPPIVEVKNKKSVPLKTFLIKAKLSFIAFSPSSIFPPHPSPFVVDGPN